MIILMNESKLNKQCADIITQFYGIADQNILYYPLNFFSKSKQAQSEPLFIIDMDANGYFQENNAPDLLAMRLNVMEISNDINDIYLLVSDVNVNKKLPTFANRFAKALSQLEERTIEVHIPTSLNYDVTFVDPLHHLGKWQVYGIYKEELSNNSEKICLDTLQKLKNKMLLWEGDDILQFLNDPQKTYSGVSYVWPR